MELLTTKNAKMKTAAYDVWTRVVWGIGYDDASALADATDWIGRNADPDDRITLETAMISEELAIAVETFGGQVCWQWAGTIGERVMIEC